MFGAPKGKSPLKSKQINHQQELKTAIQIHRIYQAPPPRALSEPGEVPVSTFLRWPQTHLFHATCVYRCLSCAVEEVVVWPEGPLVSLVILRRSAMLAGAASHDVRNKQQCVNIRPSAVQSNTLRHVSFMLLVPKADWCINR